MLMLFAFLFWDHLSWRQFLGCDSRSNFLGQTKFAYKWLRSLLMTCQLVIEAGTSGPLWAGWYNRTLLWRIKGSATGNSHGNRLTMTSLHRVETLHVVFWGVSWWVWLMRRSIWVKTLRQQQCWSKNPLKMSLFLGHIVCSHTGYNFNSLKENLDHFINCVLFWTKRRHVCISN